MSKSKLLSSLLFCIYVIIAVISAIVDNDIMSIAGLIYPFVGLVLVWLGEKMVPTRLRAGTGLINWTFIGWCILLLPVLSFLFDLIG